MLRSPGQRQDVQHRIHLGGTQERASSGTAYSAATTENCLNTRQDGGCKSHACFSAEHSSPKLSSNLFSVNDQLRRAERRRDFNVDGLLRLAAESVNQSPDDIESLRKLAEVGFNRIFLITMRDGFRMVARIPYPATVPKYFAVASEVATLAFLRSAGVPTPEVYRYSPTPDNAAGRGPFLTSDHHQLGFSHAPAS